MTRRLGSGALLATLVYGSMAGCGGESLRRDGGDEGDGGTAGTSTSGGGGTDVGGTGLGGSAGTVSGASGSGGTAGFAGTTGLGGTSGASGTGGQGDQPDFCFLEPDPGPCRGLIPRFAFDVTTTLCLPFTYGGCGGNANNFESAESCYATCDTAREDAADCTSPTDCVLMSTRCCSCEEPTLGNTVAVNADETSSVYQAMGCELVDCAPCQPIANPWLGATCTKGYCVAFDARENELTGCMLDEQCYLRNGLDCCESCDSGGNYVVLSRLSDLRPLLCGDSADVCDACVPTPPAGYRAVCIDGRCGVEHSIE